VVSLAKILKSNNVLSLANNGLIAVFGLLGFIILVRSLPTVDYGAWVLFITAANFLDMLRFGITQTAIVRFLSGADEENGKSLIGSNYVINLISTSLLAIITYTIYFFAKEGIDNSGYYLFFRWFPVVAFITLPFNSAMSVQQAKLRFDLILVLRMISVGGFMLFLLVNLIWFKSDVIVIMIAYILINAVTSVVASLSNWDGVRYIFKASKNNIKTILDFGKYTTGTLIGSNLLKSADTFIIGLSPFLGTVGVAFYSIPMKLTEIIEIPLRSFAMTAFPEMSRASIEGRVEDVKRLYYRNSGGLTLLIIPVMIFSFFFAEEFVTLIGGEQYAITANIFRIFCVYGMLLPLDRFTGVALDAVNKPKQNFIKVIYMASANILGDSLVVFGLYYFVAIFTSAKLMSLGVDDPSAFASLLLTYSTLTSLELVAIVTISFTLIGIFVGFKYLDETLHLQFKKIFTESFLFVKDFYFKFKNR
jgi:O-antigen/teichoic acid export membrane protein